MFGNIVSHIRNAIEIRQQERKLFRLLFMHSFLIGLSSSLFFVEASRNFIQKISIADMPSAYIISGFAGYLLIRLFKLLQKKMGVIKSFEWILLIFSACMILLYVGRVLFDSNVFVGKTLAYLGFVLMFAFATLFAVGFAGICLFIFNLSQSKRLLALLGTGEIMASILGYLIIPVLVKLMGASIYLLILSAVFSLISILPIHKVFLEKGRGAGSVVKSAAPPVKFNLAFIWKNPFILYLSLTTLFSIITVYFIDYSYLISVRYFSQSTGVEVATIVAMIFSIIKTGELFFSFFSSSIVASTGMKTAVLLLPYLLIFGAVMGIVSVVFFSATPVFMLFFLFLNKWTDRVIRKGVTIPSMKVMFQLNSPEERVQLQNNIDGVISQLSTIICGALLMGLSFFVDTSDSNSFLHATTIVCLVVFIVFLLISSRLFQIYKIRVQDYLRSKKPVNPDAEKLETAEISVADQAGQLTADPALTGKLNNLLKGTDLSDKRQIIQLICYYNPSAEPYAHFLDENTGTEDEFIRKITKIYFDNQHIFSRYLIIAYFLCLDFPRRVSFFKDVYHVSPLGLRIFFLKGLCRSEANIQASDAFYFMELTRQVVNEILWTETAISDLEGEQTKTLVEQLAIHLGTLTNGLLYLLQLLHDKKSVSLISEIINKKDRTEEDLLFAVELLENIILPELKKTVLPVFEPISSANRRSKLRAFFFVAEMGREDRLQDILMHDFNMVDMYTKQLTLEVLQEIDPGQRAVKAFSESRIDHLKKTAAGLADEAYQRKNKIIAGLCSMLSLDRIDQVNVLRWAVTENVLSFSKAKSNASADMTTRISIDGSVNHFIEIDLLSLVISDKIR
jgi:hypothetical protein